MTDPFNTDSDQVKYWRNKHDQEFERARSYEMDLVHAEYRVRELQAQVAQLTQDNQHLIKELNSLEDFVNGEKGA